MRMEESFRRHLDYDCHIVIQNFDYFDALHKWLFICVSKQLIHYNFVTPPHKQINFSTLYEF